MYPQLRLLTALCLLVFIANISQAQSTDDTPATTSVTVTVDTLSNRHSISPYVYGGAYPKDAPTITDSGLSVVRWGGNSTSRYNWKLFTYNAANDWYFEDFNYSEIGDADSTKFIQDVKTAGSHPLMTMPMLPWVAKAAENSTNKDWSFSVAKFGAQCGADPYNSDAGDGLKTDCSTTLTATPSVANVPLLDQPGTSDPAGSVYRNQWAAALATAFGTAPHFYDMDNEIEIWGSTHRDVHPAPTAYNEMRDTFVAESRALKTWDPKAIRLGPITCCWWFYWNGANGNDKGAHAGVDFLPWWLNEVRWQDKIAGKRSVDVLDLHAYPDTPDTSSWTQAQKQALGARIYRDYWDPTYVSESGSINQPWATMIQPNKTIPFRIPRMRAIANMIYPGTPVSFTEWSAAVAGESDFSTALGDADAYGILGRERMYLASRWVAPDPANPNYLALKLFTNYDGAHHKFANISVADANNGDPDLFSSYAAEYTAGKSLTAAGAEQRSFKHGAGAICYQRIHSAAGAVLHALLGESDDDRGFERGSVVFDHELRALLCNAARSHRHCENAGRGVGFESRHDDGRGGQDCYSAAEDYVWDRNRNLGNSAVRQRNQLNRFATYAHTRATGKDHCDRRRPLRASTTTRFRAPTLRA